MAPISRQLATNLEFIALDFRKGDGIAFADFEKEKYSTFVSLFVQMLYSLFKLLK